VDSCTVRLATPTLAGAAAVSGGGNYGLALMGNGTTNPEIVVGVPVTGLSGTTDLSAAGASPSGHV